jgi:hypothetical protein
MINRLAWRTNEIRSSEAGVQALYDDHRLVTGAGWDDADDEAAEDVLAAAASTVEPVVTPVAAAAADSADDEEADKA